MTVDVFSPMGSQIVQAYSIWGLIRDLIELYHDKGNGKLVNISVKHLNKFSSFLTGLVNMVGPREVAWRRSLVLSICKSHM